MKSTSTDPNINILFEDNHLLAIDKPAGVLSQEDRSGNPDVLTLCKAYLKEEYKKPGNVFLGLLHRLDKPVSGVMLLAKTSKAASRISKQIRERSVNKTYLAVVEGNTPKNGFYSHYLEKNKKSNRVRVVSDKRKQAKEAQLTFQTVSTTNNLSVVKINLLTGRPHQIRVQFSQEGFPIWGDELYGTPRKESIALHAYRLTVTHPTLNTSLSLSTNPPAKKPWNGFNLSNLE